MTKKNHKVPFHYSQKEEILVLSSNVLNHLLQQYKIK